jgi:hypothetical protein
MAATPDALPTDPEDLRQYCAQLLTELGDKQQRIDKLTHQLALFRRYLYGRRSAVDVKSDETVDVGNL